MIDRLYENMLELINERQEQDCNSTLCNLNVFNAIDVYIFAIIVIVHCVI